ncbi:MAG: hypothetical protein IKC24_00055 [Oscillospiraceae bacterium]|nr:hypothetical protein [Oscillospiraceae bacterium]
MGKFQRMTVRMPDGVIMQPEWDFRIDEEDYDKVQKILGRLADYEDTELTPGICANYKKFEDEAISKGVTFGRIVELMNADADGRLAVPPCKVGDTVFVVGGHIVECYIMEAYFDDKQGIEYMVSFDCEYIEQGDGICEGCPFNSWQQSYCGEWGCDGEWGQGCIKGSDFGKTVFHTREEAEKAQKERKGQ